MKDLLQVATRSGSGSAARALGSGLAGIRTGTRRFLIAGSIAALLVYLGWDLFAGVTSPTPTVAPVAIATAPASPVATASSSPVPSAASESADAAASRVGYSLDIGEIAGLAPTTPHGTIIDIWVTWDPPLTKVPKLERVLRGAVLEEVAPPVTTGGPNVAMLSVLERQVDALLWADRYGSLSATTRGS